MDLPRQLLTRSGHGVCIAAVENDRVYAMAYLLMFQFAAHSSATRWGGARTETAQYSMARRRESEETDCREDDHDNGDHDVRNPGHKNSFELGISINPATDSFDHFVGAREYGVRNIKAERLSGFQINDQLEFRGLLHR